MSRAWFSQPLETVATYWRVRRADGVAIGFTTHDRDLWFAGIRHLSAPGMVPSAIRITNSLEPDSAEVEGALSHGSIRAEDLASGRFDGARIEIGVVDWETREWHALYTGQVGEISQDGHGFHAELESRKRIFDRPVVPQTSPTCRAEFCGPGCNLSAARFEREAQIVTWDIAGDRVRIGVEVAGLDNGRVRWADGSAAGQWSDILFTEDDWLTLRDPPARADATRVILRDGCDGTIATCAARFGNAVNFQGEPHLPGTDLLTRYSIAG